MVEITNREELEAWLEGQPREVAVAIAARSALRAAPFLSDFIGDWPAERNFNDDLTSWLRCMITSGVAGTSPTPEVRSAADAAAFAAGPFAGAAVVGAYAARAATRGATIAGTTAGVAAAGTFFVAAAGADSDAAAAFSAADVIGAAAASVWKAVSRDVAHIEDGRAADGAALLFYPIWPGRPPNEVAEATPVFMDYLESGAQLAFWARWYSRMAAGNPMNWEMQKEIALIPDEDWKKGAAHVSGLIAEIEARYLAESIPYAEAIEVNPETGRLVVVPVSLENADLFQTALDKVKDALDDLRPNGELPQHCMGLEKVAKRLDRTLSKYKDNPQRVHDDFLLSAKQVQGLLDANEIADGEEVDALRTDLITGSDDIRAADPVVKASVEARMKLRIEEMRVADTEEAAVHLNKVAEAAEGELQESLVEDAQSYSATDEFMDGASRVDLYYRTAAQTPRMLKAFRDAHSETKEKATGKAVDLTTAVGKPAASFMFAKEVTEYILSFEALLRWVLQWFV